MSTTPSTLERSLRLFPRYTVATSVLPWLPVFFLYFIERAPLGNAVRRAIGRTGTAAAGIAFQSSSAVSGVVISLSMFGGAVGAAVNQRLIDRVGLRALLLASVAIQVAIVAGLSLVLNPIMLVLVMFRNFSMSMARGPMQQSFK